MASKVETVTGIEYQFARLGILLNIWWVGVKLYHNPLISLRVTRRLLGNFTKMLGAKRLVRAYKVDGKYVWDMFNPAWPSKGFSTFFKSHLREIQATANDGSGLRRLLIAITKRCPLSCEHCSEGDTLYQSDRLTYEELEKRISEFVTIGVGQLVYSGGEPLSRFDDLEKLIAHFKRECDQWIYTSGFGLTAERAQRLKIAGLNGAAISLDNHIEEAHNLFRGNSKSYYWVKEAIKNCQAQGILVALNVCPTRGYIESGGVEELIEWAAEQQVEIINILEPRAVGNFYGKDVELSNEHKERLISLVDRFSFNADNVNYPTVLFPAAYRSALPCGGGRSYMLLDFDGALYPCPFCKTRIEKASSEISLCAAEG